MGVFLGVANFFFFFFLGGGVLEIPDNFWGWTIKKMTYHAVFNVSAVANPSIDPNLVSSVSRLIEIGTNGPWVTLYTDRQKTWKTWSLGGRAEAGFSYAQCKNLKKKILLGRCKNILAQIAFG